MRLDSDYHFQYLRNIPKGIIQTRLSKNGKINFANIANLVLSKLENLVIYPDLKTKFSLINVECINGNSYGYKNISIKIPSAYLTFHFIANEDTDLIDEEFTKIKSRLVRFRIVRSSLHYSYKKPAIIYSIGLGISELEDYIYFENKLSELELLYHIIGVTTRAKLVRKHNEVEKISSAEELLWLSPRYVISNYSPNFWAFNKYIWIDYPNLIPELTTFQVFYYLIFIHKAFKKQAADSVLRCSLEQKYRLGFLLGYGKSIGVNEIIFNSLIKFLSSTSAEEYYDLSRKNIEITNPCFLACFGNFYSNLNNYSETKKFAMQLAKGSEQEIKFNLYQLLWT